MSDDLIEKLAAAFPKTFFLNQADRRPLKQGIHCDLLGADMGHGLSRTELRRAVGWYCRSPGYLAACTEGAERIDLNGLAAGSVSAEAVGAAVKSARLSQKMRRERREAKAERKAVAAAVAPEQQTEKASTPAPVTAPITAPNGKRISLADLRAAHRRRATGA